MILGPWERRLSPLLLSRPVVEHGSPVAHLLLLLALSWHLIQIRGQQLIIWRYWLHKSLLSTAWGSIPIHRVWRLVEASVSPSPHHRVLEMMGWEATSRKGCGLESLLLLRVKCGPLLLLGRAGGEHLLPLKSAALLRIQLLSVLLLLLLLRLKNEVHLRSGLLLCVIGRNCVLAGRQRLR